MCIRDRLEEGETQTLSLLISIPEDAEPQENKITVKVSSRETQTIGSLTLSINKTKREVIYEELERLRNELTSLEGRMTALNQKNISHLVGVMTRTENIIKLIEQSAMNGDWEEANDQIINADEIINNIKNSLVVMEANGFAPNFLYYYVTVSYTHLTLPTN